MIGIVLVDSREFSASVSVGTRVYNVASTQPARVLHSDFAKWRSMVIPYFLVFHGQTGFSFSLIMLCHYFTYARKLSTSTMPLKLVWLLRFFLYTLVALQLTEPITVTLNLTMLNRITCHLIVLDGCYQGRAAWCGIQTLRFVLNYSTVFVKPC